MPPGAPRRGGGVRPPRAESAVAARRSGPPRGGVRRSGRAPREVPLRSDGVPRPAAPRVARGDGRGASKTSQSHAKHAQHRRQERSTRSASTSAERRDSEGEREKAGRARKEKGSSMSKAPLATVIAASTRAPTWHRGHPRARPHPTAADLVANPAGPSRDARARRRCPAKRQEARAKPGATAPPSAPSALASPTPAAACGRGQSQRARSARPTAKPGSRSPGSGDPSISS